MYRPTEKGQTMFYKDYTDNERLNMTKPMVNSDAPQG